MDKQTDKLIADKINSLDALPHEYQPNLNSKWDLLQLDKNEKSAVILFLTHKWFAAAACLFILCTAGIVWLMQPVIKTVTPGNIVLKSIEPLIEKSTTPIVTVTSSKTSRVLNLTKHKIKNAIEIKPEISFHENEIVETKDTSVVNIIAVQQAPDTGNALFKNKKQRFVQMDFDDNIIQPGERNISAQSTRLRFSLGNKTKNNQLFESESSLKLKQNF